MSEELDPEYLMVAIKHLQELVNDQSEQITALKAQIKTSKPFTLEKKVKWDEIRKLP
jgi:hypothetical protein